MFAGTKRVHAMLSWRRMGVMVQYVIHGQNEVDGVLFALVSLQFARAQSCIVELTF